ncbi:L-fucose:H+ symporter permease [Rhodothermaceae bacterium RA]|nr:L-fucose:H+ symporter permease [Rhodothermaceae bacterium RA]
MSSSPASQPATVVPGAAASPEAPLIPAGMLWPFALVTSLFALWGFANDITNPLVKAFQEIFLISARQSSLVQTAFYGGYATMALPAAIFIQRYSYKAGIVCGLGLYALGALLFIPASWTMQFWVFLLALYILTFGLAFLETTANPYVLSMGPEATATRRLNLAQAFNPIGSLLGMVVASQVILANLEVGRFRAAQMAAHPEYASLLPGEVDARITAALAELARTQPGVYEAMQAADLATIRTPYVVLALVVLAVMLTFLLTKMPRTGEHTGAVHLGATFRRLAKNRAYVEGVVAQAFYVGAQIMCWTFIIHYAMSVLGMTAVQAQNHNIIAMVIFCSSRFICTYLLKYLSPGKLLMALAIGAMACTLGTIFLPGYAGLYSLIGISACMSLMFPSIYGIALHGLGDDAKIASAGLIFAIVGGALMPPLQGSIIDLPAFDLGFMVMDSVRASFVLPLISFAVIAVFGYRTFRVHQRSAVSGQP